ncbi:hypothetical protein OC846_003960 [Tilletia horrida]|uniref:[Histone H3]-trimethyl-L-lysine(9) demethylase n=1 Tax=Tilletia horrida TaxID=155126 RepID=A0AAN6GQJ9_9BASI|nr:hypothetical protein OC846_003960 [Tilletia horrida]
MSTTTSSTYSDIVVPPSPSASDRALSRSSSSSDLSDLEEEHNSSVIGDEDDQHSEDEDDGASSLSELSASSDDGSLSEDDDLSSPPDTPVKRPRGRPPKNRSGEAQVAQPSTSSARRRAPSSPATGSRRSLRTHGLPPEAHPREEEEHAAAQIDESSIRRTRSGNNILRSAESPSKSARMSTRRSSASASLHAVTDQTPRKRGRPSKHPRPLPTPSTPSTSSSFLEVSIGPSPIVKSDFSPGGDPSEYEGARAPKRRRTLSSSTTAPLTPGDGSVEASSSTTKKRRKIKNRGWGRPGGAKAPKSASDPSAPPRAARKRLFKPDPTLDYLTEVFSLNESNGEAFQYNGDALSVPFPFTFDPNGPAFQPDGDKGKAKEGDVSSSSTILEMPLEGPLSVLEASHKDPLPIPSSWIPPPPPQAVRYLARLEKRKQKEEEKRKKAEAMAAAKEDEQQESGGLRKDVDNSVATDEMSPSALDILASAGSARRTDERASATTTNAEPSTSSSGEGSTLTAAVAPNTSDKMDVTPTSAAEPAVAAPAPLRMCSSFLSSFLSSRLRPLLLHAFPRTSGLEPGTATSEESASSAAMDAGPPAQAAMEPTRAGSSIAAEALLSALPKHEAASGILDIDTEDDASDTESDDGITPLRPSSFYPTPGGSGGFPGIPIFTPTMSQFRDFYSMCKRIDAWGMRTGIVKIIPPKEWTDALPHLNVEEVLGAEGGEDDKVHTGATRGEGEARGKADAKQGEGHDAGAGPAVPSDPTAEGNTSAAASATTCSKATATSTSVDPPVPPLRTIRIRNAIRQLVLPVGSGAYSQTNMTTPNKVWNVKQWADICASEGQRGPELERMKRKIESLKAGADALNVHGLSGYRRRKRTGAAGEDDDAVEDLEEMLKETEGVRTRSGRKHRTARDEEADDEEEEEDEGDHEARNGAAPTFTKQPRATASTASGSLAGSSLAPIAAHSPPRSENGGASLDQAMQRDDNLAGTHVLTPPASHANDGSDRSDHQVGSPPATVNGASSTDSALTQTIAATSIAKDGETAGPSEDANASGDSPAKPAKKVSMPDRTTQAEWQAFDYRKCWLREAMDLEDQTALPQEGGEGGEAGPAAAGGKALPSATEWTIDVCREIEGEYWRNLSMGKPAMYGADLPGTLFKPGMKVWNVGMLDNLLTRMRFRRKLRGVTTPYLYFGMWRATFAWHLEDMDLYSINYIHFGAPKQWYAIPQTERKRFETAMASAFPGDARKCPHFMRHKSYLVSPRYLARHNIKPLKLVQHAGEFVITYPYGYHSGFNLGFNCAESVNFALDTWVEIGRNAGFCKCRTDSVQMDVEALMEEAMEEEAAREKKEAEDAEKKEKARLKKLNAAAAKKASLAGGKRKAVDDESGAAVGAPKTKKSKKEVASEDGASIAPGEEDDTSVPAVKTITKPKGYPCVFCVSVIEDDMVPVPPAESSPSTSPKIDSVQADAGADSSVLSAGSISSAKGKASVPQPLKYAHRLCANVLPETWVHREVEMVKKRRYVKKVKPVVARPPVPQQMHPPSQTYPPVQGYHTPHYPAPYGYPTPGWQPPHVAPYAAPFASQPRSAFAPHPDMYNHAYPPHVPVGAPGAPVPSPYMAPGYQPGHTGAVMSSHDPTSVRERWAGTSAPYISGYAATAPAAGYGHSHRRSPAANASAVEVVPTSDDEDTKVVPPPWSRDHTSRPVAVPSSDPGDEEAPILIDEDEVDEAFARRHPGEFEAVVEEVEQVKSEEVRGFENIERARWNLKCSLCPTNQLAKQGCKVQCTRAKCSRAAHVTCANLADSGWYVAILKKVEADRLEYGGIHTKKRSKGTKSKAKGKAAPTGAVTTPNVETDGASTSAFDAGDVSMGVADGDGAVAADETAEATGEAADAVQGADGAEPTVPERDELAAEERLVLLCKAHNPEIKKQEAIRRALALREQCLGLEPMTLINVRAGSNSGVWQVLLLEVIDVPGGEAAVKAGSPPTTRGEVVVMYDGQQHRIKWGRIEFGNGSTMRSAVAAAVPAPGAEHAGAIEPALSAPLPGMALDSVQPAVAAPPAPLGAPGPPVIQYGARVPPIASIPRASVPVAASGMPPYSHFAPAPIVYHSAPVYHHHHHGGMPHGPGAA